MIYLITTHTAAPTCWYLCW